MGRMENYEAHNKFFKIFLCLIKNYSKFSAPSSNSAIFIVNLKVNLFCGDLTLYGGLILTVIFKHMTLNSCSSDTHSGVLN
jgi:hypothetical protein